ncbi:MAG: DUF1043 family protein, partial [Pseudomonadota bacterium]
DKNDAKALVALREEFDDYRGSVNEHFAQTSALFQDMTEKYRDVYNHLAAGAQQFGDAEASPPRLEIVQPAAQLAAAATPAPEAATAPAVEVAEPAAEFAEAADTATAAAAPVEAAAPADTAPAAVTELDESELADLAQTAEPAEPAAAAEPAEPEREPDPNTTPEPIGAAREEPAPPARSERNTFRNMPPLEEAEAPAAGSGLNGTEPTASKKSEAAATEPTATA